MARSKQRRKRKRQARTSDAFFEALPIGLAPIGFLSPVTVADESVLARPDWTASPGVVRTKRLLTNSYAIICGALFDIGNVGWRVVRALVGYRARALYVALIAGSALAGVIAVKLEATKLSQQYAPAMATPAMIVSAKKSGITLTDRNGTVLYSTSEQGSGGVIPLSTLPKNLTNATLAAEDPTFYQHDGYSAKSIVRAAYVDATSGSAAEGGSTLTQQLVKNALLTSDKTIVRKFKELVLAGDLEQKYSKDEILSMYMSEVPYGQGSYGVEEASQTYFHLPAAQLDLAQSALLAGLPQATSLLDPTTHPDAARDRRNYVLERMASLGMITIAEAKTAEAEPITVSARTVQILAPHFVFYVLDQLQQQYGSDVLDEGRVVTTSLDLTKQNAAQATVTNQVNALASNHVTNGGLISLDPTNGDILAMVGSTDYNQPNFGAVNVTLSELQPGSSFKPFAYVTAFERGWTGASIVQDTPVSFPDGASTYTPLDYDNMFRGPVTLRYALANSLNIPAIRVLQFATIPATLNTAKSLGITTLKDASDYGLALVLGGGDVRPIDMAAAYGAFATGGHKVTPRSVLKITDKLGRITYTAPGVVTGASVLDPRYAYMITSILSDNSARTPDFGPNSPLKLTRPDAAKTGTTNDFRDNWTVGYTPNLVTAVWVGNNDHSAMQGVNGITGAAPIWHNYMEAALTTLPIVQFTPPPGITMEPVTAKGCIAGPGESVVANEAFLSTALPTSCAQPAPAPADPTTTPVAQP